MVSCTFRFNQPTQTLLSCLLSFIKDNASLRFHRNKMLLSLLFENKIAKSTGVTLFPSNNLNNEGDCNL